MNTHTSSNSSSSPRSLSMAGLTMCRSIYDAQGLCDCVELDVGAREQTQPRISNHSIENSSDLVSESESDHETYVFRFATAPRVDRQAIDPCNAQSVLTYPMDRHMQKLIRNLRILHTLCGDTEEVPDTTRPERRAEFDRAVCKWNMKRRTLEMTATTRSRAGEGREKVEPLSGTGNVWPQWQPPLQRRTRSSREI